MGELPGAPSRRFRVVAVGAGGRRIAEGLSADDLFASSGGIELRAVAVGTDASSLESAAADVRVHVDRPWTGRKGSARDELRWRDALDRELYRADLTLLVVGGDDSEALEIASVACRIGRDRGGLALAFVAGRPSGDGSTGVPQLVAEDIAAVVEAADSAFFVPAFASAPCQGDALIRQSMRALLQISRQPGLLHYSLKELSETFHHAGQGEIAAGRGKGEARFSDAAQAVLASPTLVRPLHYAACVALHVRAGASSTLYDLNDLSATVAAACEPRANLWTAVYLDSPDEDAVEVTLVAAGLPRS